ncbi:MAG TPA: FMN-binding protein [Polyangia bacterium]
MPISTALPASGALAASETTYFTPRSVLATFFPKSEHVTYKTYAVASATRARLTRRLGYAPARDRYTIFMATTAERVDGYAVIDEQQGLHQPITFATRLSARGIVERVEIMAYRETRGDEVRDPRFCQQFVGKTSRDSLRINDDLDAVSGATVSSVSLSLGVRRAIVLVEELALGSAMVDAESAPHPVVSARIDQGERRASAPVHQ